MPMKGRKRYEEGNHFGWAPPLGVRPKTHLKAQSGLSGLVAPHPPRLKTKSLAFGVVNEGHEAGIGFLYTLYGERILTET